ncbi:GrpE-domain-containing protein [Collybia nuda]|uniref:GrpE protein homolog, mitochondrial n=1 Tax=Collybia nuda TaxID=64659 RepID=A0A9P6CLA6_9AGAR|nr:GrpE-domain-containing protein [Collybia nuda]
MSAAFVLQSFRSRAASLSSRSLPRAAVRSYPKSLGRRHYSEQKLSTSETEEGKDGTRPDNAPLTPDQEKLKAKEAEVVDLTGRLRYLQADFLNLQRNAAREKEQTRDFAITRFAGDLLETADVLSLALKSLPPGALEPSTPSETPSPSTGSPKTHQQHLQELYTGVEITQRLLLQTLFKYHVKPFDPTGDKFDPNLHEALYQAPVPGKEPGTVIDCQKIGYMIKDRVLRAAQVGVAQDAS